MKKIIYLTASATIILIGYKLYKKYQSEKLLNNMSLDNLLLKLRQTYKACVYSGKILALSANPSIIECKGINV